MSDRYRPPTTSPALSSSASRSSTSSTPVSRARAITDTVPPAPGSPSVRCSAATAPATARVGGSTRSRQVTTRRVNSSPTTSSLEPRLPGERTGWSAASAVVNTWFPPVTTNADVAVARASGPPMRGASSVSISGTDSGVRRTWRVRGCCATAPSHGCIRVGEGCWWVTTTAMSAVAIRRHSTPRSSREGWSARCASWRMITIGRSAVAAASACAVF